MSDDQRFREAYTEYNRVLRTWFVAFGAGAPAALILSNEARSLLSNADDGLLIVWLLAVGVILQITVTFLNKYIAWANQVIELNRTEDGGISENEYWFTIWFSNLTKHIWIDIFSDIVTGALFIYAIIKLYPVLAGA